MNAVSAGAEPKDQSASPDDAGWSFQFRWVVILLVFAAHIGFIFALGDRKSIAPAPAAAALGLNVVRDPAAFPLLADPTVFALPHPKGFGGQVWLQKPANTPPVFRWTEDPRFLPLADEKLASDAFARFKSENQVAPLTFTAKPPTVIALPLPPGVTLEIPRPSALRISGGLSGRRLLNPPELPIQESSELLTNTLIQVLVSSDGLVRSPVPLMQPPGSGSETADRYALQLAWGLRFEPSSSKDQEPVIGLLIFEWQTKPIAATNSPPINR